MSGVARHRTPEDRLTAYFWPDRSSAERQQQIPYVTNDRVMRDAEDTNRPTTDAIIHIVNQLVAGQEAGR